MYTGGNAVEINTEADSTDMTECYMMTSQGLVCLGFSGCKCVDKQQT